MPLRHVTLGVLGVISIRQYFGFLSYPTLQFYSGRGNWGTHNYCIAFPVISYAKESEIDGCPHLAAVRLVTHFDFKREQVERVATAFSRALQAS